MGVHRESLTRFEPLRYKWPEKYQSSKEKPEKTVAPVRLLAPDPKGRGPRGGEDRQRSRHVTAREGRERRRREERKRRRNEAGRNNRTGAETEDKVCVDVGDKE